MYYKKNSSEINLIEKLDNIGKFNQTFRILGKLNQILEQILPAHLKTNCHIGAIDERENIVVLYVTNQQLFHIIRNFSNTILSEFANNNFHFDKLLIRNSIVIQKALHRKDPLNSSAREKLSQLANEIGKPEIIQTPEADELIDDEIYI